MRDKKIKAVTFVKYLELLLMIRKRKHPDYLAEKQKLKIKAKAFFPKK